MKLKKGQVVYIGKEKFVNEIPDDKAIKLGLKKPEKKQEKKEDNK